MYVKEFFSKLFAGQPGPLLVLTLTPGTTDPADIRAGLGAWVVNALTHGVDAGGGFRVVAVRDGAVVAHLWMGDWQPVGHSRRRTAHRVLVEDGGHWRVIRGPLPPPPFDPADQAASTLLASAETGLTGLEGPVWAIEQP